MRVLHWAAKLGNHKSTDIHVAVAFYFKTWQSKCPEIKCNVHVPLHTLCATRRMDFFVLEMNVQCIQIWLHIKIGCRVVLTTYGLPVMNQSEKLHD